MRRVFLFGVTCAVLALVVMYLGDSLGLPIQNVLSGIAIGGALGLIRTHSPLARISAFVIGLVVGIIFFLLRAALLPGSWLGNAIAVVAVILVMTLISGLTGDRLPLWAMFMAAALFAASYGTNYDATQWLIFQQLPSTAVGLLFTASAGFVVAIFAEIRVEHGGVDQVDPMAPTPPEAGGVNVQAPVTAGASAAGSGDSGLSVMNTTANATDRVGM